MLGSPGRSPSSEWRLTLALHPWHSHGTPSRFGVQHIAISVGAVCVALFPGLLPHGFRTLF